MATPLPSACFTAAANDKPAGPAPATTTSKTRGAGSLAAEGEEAFMATLSASRRRRARGLGGALDAGGVDRLRPTRPAAIHTCVKQK